MEMMIRKVFKSLILGSLLLLTACTENVDPSARYVIKGKTAWEYLQSHDYYSEYCQLLQTVHASPITETTVKQLLSARGHYTVFAPTNDAISAYLQELCDKGLISGPSWEAFDDSLVLDSVQKTIVLNSIIDSGDHKQAFGTYDFPTTQNAEILTPNMNDRKVSIYYNSDDSDGDILVSGCLMDIRNRDIMVLNGMIHCMNQVVAPSNNTLSQYFSDAIQSRRKGYYVMANLALAVGLRDTLNAVKDEAYELLYLTNALKEPARTPFPPHRYYGFTCFAEPDSLWEVLLGKDALDITPDDVYNYLDGQGIYPDAKRNGNYTSSDNLLNRFVTYHFLPWRLNSDRLVYHVNSFGYDMNSNEIGCAVSEYYTSLGLRRMMKIYESRESHGVFLNRCPQLDNKRHGNYHELSCQPGREGVLVGESPQDISNEVRNAKLYRIDQLLLFDENTQNNLGRERMRWDFAAMFPEFANNDIRLNGEWASTPTDESYRYLDDAWMQRGSCFTYDPGLTGAAPSGHQITYNGDEISAWLGSDIIFRLPPVPKDGVYELRYGVHAADNRTIAQIYWGNNRERLAPQGIPTDLRLGKINEIIEWVTDSDDDDYNAEKDKNMKNHEYMKGPQIDNTRQYYFELRRVVVRQFMKANETYYLRVKDVSDLGYLLFDYLEYCPKEVYDNPNEPEDIW